MASSERFVNVGGMAVRSLKDFNLWPMGRWPLPESHAASIGRCIPGCCVMLACCAQLAKATAGSELTKGGQVAAFGRDITAGGGLQSTSVNAKNDYAAKLQRDQQRGRKPRPVGGRVGPDLAFLGPFCKDAVTQN